MFDIRIQCLRTENMSQIEQSYKIKKMSKNEENKIGETSKNNEV